MTAKTALPLTQQVVAWVLQSMGPIDDLSMVSRSTVKNALRGDIVWRAWDGLIDEAIRVLLPDVGEEQRETLRQGNRESDGHFAALDYFGLPEVDLLPPVLRILLPQAGVRLGALAAMVDKEPARDSGGPPAMVSGLHAGEGVPPAAVESGHGRPPPTYACALE